MIEKSEDENERNININLNIDNDIPNKAINLLNKKFPASTKEKIIVPSLHFTFDKNSYIEAYLKSFLDKEDFVKIIEELNKMMSKSFTEKRKYDNVGTHIFAYFVAFCSLILTVVFLVALTYSKQSSDVDIGLFIVAIVLMIATIVLVLALSVFTFCQKMKEHKTLDDIIKENIEKYLEYINNYFQGYLEWVYIPVRHYIEIKVRHFLYTENSSGKVKNIINAVDEYEEEEECEKEINDSNDKVNAKELEINEYSKIIQHRKSLSKDLVKEFYLPKSSGVHRRAVSHVVEPHIFKFNQ